MGFVEMNGKIFCKDTRKTREDVARELLCINRENFKDHARWFEAREIRSYDEMIDRLSLRDLFSEKIETIDGIEVELGPDSLSFFYYEEDYDNLPDRMKDVFEALLPDLGDGSCIWCREEDSFGYSDVFEYEIKDHEVNEIIGNTFRAGTKPTVTDADVLDAIMSASAKIISDKTCVRGIAEKLEGVTCVRDILDVLSMNNKEEN